MNAMLLTKPGVIAMSYKTKKKYYDPDQDQDQDQDQKQDQAQAELQAQLQGQAQGQAQGQGQFQFAVQSVESKNDNDNDNENKNENSNESKNENENKNENTNEVKNDVDNKLDNSVDNKLNNDVDNKIENSVENKVENTVEVKVDVDLDLDLDAFGRPDDTDVIDIDEIKDIDSSVVMPDAVSQTLTGNGNQFNIDQVNNLYDKDVAWGQDVYNSSSADFDAKADGGEVKLDDPKIDIQADGGAFGDGLAATADGIASNEAFTQNIVMGANIQFNNIEMSVAGNDLTDDHSI
jgi:hypothetical protein